MSYTDKQKNAQYSKAWYDRNRERLLQDQSRKERNRISAIEWRRNNREAVMLSAAKSRAKREGYAFDIDVSDIIIPDQCPICLIPLAFTDGKQDDGTPALDRIDNTKGYVKGNVQVISHKANRHKADLTLEAIERLYLYSCGRKKLA